MGGVSDLSQLEFELGPSCLSGNSQNIRWLALIRPSSGLQMEAESSLLAVKCLFVLRACTTE